MKPSKDKIENEVKKLKGLVSQIRPRSVFGTDNIAQLKTQIIVLVDNLDDDDIYSRYDHSGLDEEILSAALDARQWLDGEGEADTLSEEWELLRQNR